MLDGTYKTNLTTPIGAITGTITLVSHDKNVDGIIETMGMQNKLQGVKISDQQCNFSGQFQTPIGPISYHAICRVNDQTLHLETITNKGNFQINGTKIRA